MSSPPLLLWRPDLGLTATSDAEGSCYYLEDPRRGKFFRLGIAEFTLLSQFDGQRSGFDALQSANKSLGDQSFSETDASSVIQWGLKSGLLIDAAASEQASESLADVSARANWNPLSIRIPLGSPDRWCERVLPWVDWMFGKPAFVVWLLITVLAAHEVAVDWDRFVSSTADILIPSHWCGLGLAWLVLKVVHESAHALVCKRYGGEVRQVGFAFLFFVPVAYVDVTSCWRFPSRWQRMHTAAAGMYAELVLAAFAILAAGYVDSVAGRNFLDNVAVMASVTTLLFNLNPLSRFDGYYILADFVQTPNLYAKGVQAVQQFAGRWLLGTVPASKPASLWLVAYGIATQVWSLTVMVGLIVASSLYFHGLGMVLSALITVSWARQWMQRLGQLIRGLSVLPLSLRLRVAFRTLSVVAACAVLLLVTPWPFAITAPGVIEFSPLSVVRAESSGFVLRVLVADGEAVSEGQPLVELQNEELERETSDLELSIEQSLRRERLAADGHDTAATQVEQQQRDALQRRLAERQRQVERLTLRAPFAGVVISRKLAALPGSFITEGSEVLSIGDPMRREFVASVAQEDLLAAQHVVEQPIVVHFHGHDDLPGRLQRVHPKASAEPEHLCLCAPFGGPLPIRTLPDEGHNRSRSANGFELLQPHFRLTIALTEQRDQRPFAGELGWISLDRRQTCAQHILTWLSRWGRAATTKS